MSRPMSSLAGNDPASVPSGFRTGKQEFHSQAAGSTFRGLSGPRSILEDRQQPGQQCTEVLGQPDIARITPSFR